VDANSHARQIAIRGVRLLQPEGKRDRRAWGLEGQEAAVPSPIHDTPMHLCGKLSHLLLVSTYQFFDCLIAKLPLQRGRVCEVREDQRENPGDPGRVSHR
jgi:hypothetical protein